MRTKSQHTQIGYDLQRLKHEANEAQCFIGCAYPVNEAIHANISTFIYELDELRSRLVHLAVTDQIKASEADRLYFGSKYREDHPLAALGGLDEESTAWLRENYDRRIKIRTKKKERLDLQELFMLHQFFSNATNTIALVGLQSVGKSHSKATTLTIEQTKKALGVLARIRQKLSTYAKQLHQEVRS